MYKIVFVVAVFAFALQGALSSPVDENETPIIQPFLLQSEPKNASAVENKVANADPTATTLTAAAETASTTVAPKNGASSTGMCLLLVQVSSLALVAKHILL